MLGGQHNHGWQLCFPLELQAGGSDFRLYDGSDLKTYLLMRWLGPDLCCLSYFVSEVIGLCLSLFVTSDERRLWFMFICFLNVAALHPNHQF